MIEAPRLFLALALATLALFAGACGGGDDGAGDDASTTTETSTPQSEGTPAPDERTGTPPPEVELTDLEEAAAEAGCELELDLPDERELALKGELEFEFEIRSNGHVVDDGSEPEYMTSPPTSGVHSDVPLPDGAYLDYPRPINFVHTLEHGRVAVQYSPDLSEEDQLALKGVFDEDPAGMLMFPNPEMPYAVAAVAWTNLLGCEAYTPEALDAIRDFRDEFRGKGPEDIPF